MAMLVGARALQGIGGGGITVTATALIGEVIPLRDRGRYQGALGAVFGVTTVIGPLLGGYFTDHLTWRWAFWINVPVSIVVFFVAAAAIPALAAAHEAGHRLRRDPVRRPGRHRPDPGHQLGRHPYPWGSATIIGLFAGSAVALGIFVWVESRVAAPILPTRLFRDPVFTVCCVLSFVVGFAMLGALTFLPTYMQFVDGVSATTSGLRTLPMVAGMLIDLDRQRRPGRPDRPIQDLPGRRHGGDGACVSADVPDGARPHRRCCNRFTCSSSVPASACACRCWSSSCRTRRASKTSASPPRV